MASSQLPDCPPLDCSLGFRVDVFWRDDGGFFFWGVEKAVSLLVAIYIYIYIINEKKPERRIDGGLLKVS